MVEVSGCTRRRRRSRTPRSPSTPGRDSCSPWPGSPLPASDRRMLDAFAAQAAAVLERDRLAVRAADAVRLRESDAVRTALLAAVSHDLRTPLAGIKASIATLRDPQLALSATTSTTCSATPRTPPTASTRCWRTCSTCPGCRPVPCGPCCRRPRSTRWCSVPCAAYRTDRWTIATGDSSPLILTDAGLLERVGGQPGRERRALLARGSRRTARRGGSPGTVSSCGSSTAAPACPRRSGCGCSRRSSASATRRRAPGSASGWPWRAGLAEAVGATIEAEDTPGGGLTMVVSVPLAGPAELARTVAHVTRCSWSTTRSRSRARSRSTCARAGSRSRRWRPARRRSSPSRGSGPTSWCSTSASRTWTAWRCSPASAGGAPCRWWCSRRERRATRRSTRSTSEPTTTSRSRST